MKTLLEYLNKKPDIKEISDECIEALQWSLSTFKKDIYNYVQNKKDLSAREYKSFEKELENEINLLINNLTQLSEDNVYGVAYHCKNILNIIDKSWVLQKGNSELLDICRNIDIHTSADVYITDALEFYDVVLINCYHRVKERIKKLKKDTKEYLKSKLWQSIKEKN